MPARAWLVDTLVKVIEVNSSYKREKAKKEDEEGTEEEK